MIDTTLIRECSNPWVFWWYLLPHMDRYTLGMKYFPNRESWPQQDEIKFIWEEIKPKPLKEFDWLKLADLCLPVNKFCSLEHEREIWRQVYRIASQRL